MCLAAAAARGYMNHHMVRVCFHHLEVFLLETKITKVTEQPSSFLTQQT